MRPRTAVQSKLVLVWLLGFVCVYGFQSCRLVGWRVKMCNWNPTHIIFCVDFNPNPHTHKHGSTRTRPV
ncbi:hypothetical protein Hanom_Chr06g00574971 [Helianthus anomalus]